MEVTVNHEVESEYLKVVLLLAVINNQCRSLHAVPSYFFQLRVYILEETMLSSVLLLQVPLELVVGDFVSLLILAVIGQMLLNCVIGEMHRSVIVLGGVFVGGSPDVAMLVPVSLDMPIHARHQHVMSDVELPFLVQERLVQVLLDDVSALVPIL